MTSRDEQEYQEFLAAAVEFFEWAGADEVELEDVKHEGGDKWTAVFRKNKQDE